MLSHISTIAIVVPDYDAAIAHYVGELGFTLREDTDFGDGKRWVTIASSQDSQTALLLAKAVNEAQHASIGDQSGGRVFLILNTNDFAASHHKFQKAGIEFLEEPRDESYGRVAVFKDKFGNKWDLIEPAMASNIP